MRENLQKIGEKTVEGANKLGIIQEKLRIQKIDFRGKSTVGSGGIRENPWEKGGERVEK